MEGIGASLGPRALARHKEQRRNSDGSGAEDRCSTFVAALVQLLLFERLHVSPYSSRNTYCFH